MPSTAPMTALYFNQRDMINVMLKKQQSKMEDGLNTKNLDTEETIKIIIQLWNTQ